MVQERWRSEPGIRSASTMMAMPGVSRVGVLTAPQDTAHRERVVTIQSAAKSLALPLPLMNVSRADDVPRAFDAATRARRRGHAPRRSATLAAASADPRARDEGAAAVVSAWSEFAEYLLVPPWTWAHWSPARDRGGVSAADADRAELPRLQDAPWNPGASTESAGGRAAGPALADVLLGVCPARLPRADARWDGRAGRP
jgi:hypothetical protein